MASTGQMTDDEIEHVINVWCYDPALWDCSMEMMQFRVET